MCAPRGCVCLPVQVRKTNPLWSLDDVVRGTLKQVEGAYAVCFIFADQPNLLIGARKGSPLLLGIGACLADLCGCMPFTASRSLCLCVRVFVCISVFATYPHHVCMFVL